MKYKLNQKMQKKYLKNKNSLMQTDEKKKYDIFIKYLSKNLDNSMCLDISKKRKKRSKI